MQNRVEIEGYLGNDPTFNDAGKTDIANFSISYNEKFIKNGEEVRQSFWIDCSAFGYTANLAKQLKKKDCISVVGKLKEDSYVNKDGVQVKKFKLIVFQINKKLFIEAPTTETENKAKTSKPQEVSEDLPF